jgi:hypothetical protein
VPSSCLPLSLQALSLEQLRARRATVCLTCSSNNAPHANRRLLLLGATLL